MEFIKINDFISYIGVNDRETDKFENLWPLPQGVSYNSYLIKDDKNALLDTVKVNKTDEFLKNLDSALEGEDLDYLVIHHMEPDHSGALTSLLERYPNIELVGNKKTIEFLDDFYGIAENIIEVDTGDSLDLGQTSLTFYKTPMVHWPESMVSYEESSKILFSQDIFGKYGSLDGGVFDYEQGDFAELEPEIRRYFSNIVGKNTNAASMSLKKLDLDNLDIEMICPIHGPIWSDCVDDILAAYDRYTSFETEKGVVIAYGSMYGTNAKIADFLGRALAENGIDRVVIHDTSKTNISYILSDIWKYKGLILGSCSYDNGPLPTMVSLLNNLKQNKIDKHVLGIYGSYSWSGGGVKGISEFAEGSKFDLVGQVEVKSRVKEEDERALNDLAKKLAEKVLA